MQLVPEDISLRPLRQYLEGHLKLIRYDGAHSTSIF